MEGVVTAEGLLQGMQPLQQGGVDRGELAGTVIAQQVVDGGQLRGDILAVGPEGGIELFAGMQVIETQAALPGRLRHGGPQRGREQGCTGGDGTVQKTSA